MKWANLPTIFLTIAFSLLIAASFLSIRFLFEVYRDGFFLSPVSSTSTVTIGGFSTQLAANTKFADLVARADSDTIKVSSLQTFVNKLRIDLDSDTSKLQSLDTTIGSIKAKLDSDSNRLQAISTEFKARLDSDTTRISSINRQLNINTANIQSITLDSDGVVNMFNEHSLINITADSDILKPLFRKVMNDFTIRDVGNNIVFSFFDET